MKQDQKSYFYDLKKSRSGQAVVEYVLLLVVIVGLILGSAKIFKTIDQGMQKYIGDYFVCLMEYGELPTLGVKDTDLKKHTDGSGRKCDNQFEAFSFENGRPATAGGGGAGSGSNRNNSENANGRNGSGSDDSRGAGAGNSASDRDRDKNNSDGNDTSGGSDLAGRGRNGSGANRRPEVKKAGSGFATLDGGMGEEESKVRVLDEDGDGGSDSEKRKRRRPKKTQLGYADEYKAIGGRALQEIEKTQRRRGTVRKPTSTVLKIDAEEGISGPYRKTVTPPQRQVAAEIKDKDSGFSFGALFKWLLIAGMVVAIVVFFGGQLLNYSNSDS